MKFRKLVLLAGLLALVFVLGQGLWNAVRHDRCLDLGGRWHAARGLCEGAP